MRRRQPAHPRRAPASADRQRSATAAAAAARLDPDRDRNLLQRPPSVRVGSSAGSKRRIGSLAGSKLDQPIASSKTSSVTFRWCGRVLHDSEILSSATAETVLSHGIYFALQHRLRTANMCDFSILFIEFVFLVNFGFGCIQRKWLPSNIRQAPFPLHTVFSYCTIV